MRFLGVPEADQLDKRVQTHSHIETPHDRTTPYRGMLVPLGPLRAGADEPTDADGTPGADETVDDGGTVDADVNADADTSRWSDGVVDVVPSNSAAAPASATATVAAARASIAVVAAAVAVRAASAAAVAASAASSVRQC